MKSIFYNREMEEPREDEKLRIMIISFGPPELAETFGGAAANFAKAGHSVILVAMCLFLPESVIRREYGLSDQEQLNIRMNDFKRMGDVLGAEKCIHVGYGNAEWGKTLKETDYEPTARIVTLLRQERPHIVLCPDYGYDYNPGKIGTAEIVKKACYVSGYEHEYDEDSKKGLAPWCVRRMYFGDIEFGDSSDCKHTHYLDITDTLPLKIQALQACSLEAISLAYTSMHVGQYTPHLGAPISLKECCAQVDADYEYISSIEDDRDRWLALGQAIFAWELTRRAIRRGMECGVKYAEAYRMWHPANFNPVFSLLPWR